jgi:hypothetical protein
MQTFNEFLLEGAARGIILVKVASTKGGKFLYAFPLPAASQFKKGPMTLTMVHLDKSKECWRVMMENGGLVCKKSMWPKLLTHTSFVKNEQKTPLHKESLAYSDPHKFVRDFERVLLEETDIDWK